MKFLKERMLTDAPVIRKVRSWWVVLRENTDGDQTSRT
jgi:hypothetical protein